MAVKFRKNPAPLRGALFVSNPRKRKSTKKKRKTTRRRKNRLAIRKNRLAIRKNGTKKGMRRKTARKNRLAIRKNGTRKGMRRKTARKAYRKNPKMLKQLSSVLSPFNSKSFGGMEFGFMTKLAKQVSDIAPFGLPIGKFGSSVIHMSSPVLFGMGSGLLMTTGADLFSRIPYIGGIFQGKFGIAATGMGLAILSQLLPLKVETKKSLAIACTVGAGAINGYQLVQEAGGIRDALMDIYPNMSGLHMGSLGKFGSVHMGDGMAYDVQPLSGLAFSGVHLQGTDTMYADAKLADSYLCPSDLSLDEGRSGIAGKKAYSNRFGQSPKRATQKAGSYSRHAGKEGHRWGWMIKLIGFDRFQKLCKMSPQKRQSVIKKMKSAAMEHARAEFDQQVALESTASPISGLNMDLSGLSVDPMGGLAAVGAGF